MGHGLLGLNWLGMGISYYFDSFVYPKIAGFVFAAACGLGFVSTFVLMMCEVCGADLLFIGLFMFLISNFTILEIAPYILTSTENYGHWCIGNAAICLSITLFCSYYFIETEGLERKDIFDL